MKLPTACTSTAPPFCAAPSAWPGVHRHYYSATDRLARSAQTSLFAYVLPWDSCTDSSIRRRPALAHDRRRFYSCRDITQQRRMRPWIRPLTPIRNEVTYKATEQTLLFVDRSTSSLHRHSYSSTDVQLQERTDITIRRQTVQRANWTIWVNKD